MRRTNPALAVGTGIAVLAVMALLAVPLLTGARSPAHRSSLPDGVRAGAAATTTTCGSTLVRNTTLDGDLQCVGTALTIGHANVTLNLNGHTIIGPGRSASTAVGVAFVKGAKHAKVENGNIINFNTGISISNVSSALQTVTVTNVSVTLNNVGIRDAGEQTTITDSAAFGNQNEGLSCDGCIDATYTDNNFLNNATTDHPENVPTGIGLLLSNAQDFTVTGNHASGNSAEGIYAESSTGVLKDNVANDNLGAGIYSTGISNVDGGGNTGKNNERATDAAHRFECYAVACD